ncbi:hypothetical protein [Sedimenticola sp.]|uniref:hypothetical protein n=1 Tax=Sedimenticola sp. TaxID=1940285 RepID=UPI003D127AC1
MKILSKALTAVAGVAAVSAAMITDVQAVPSFARQTGMACVSCHSGNYPGLNAFGRAFLTSGYTMRGAAPLVEGEDLSIPADLKMALITKIRYELSDAVDGGRGEVQWPDEAAFLVGGRVAENIGFLSEVALAAQDVDLATDKTNGNFLSFKTHFNVTPNVAVVMYGTDALGIGYGMELMNTGLKRSQRPIENRRGMSAFHRMYFPTGKNSSGIGSGAATGLAVAYHDNDMMVSYAQWAPTYGNVNANIFGGLAGYVRANYFMNIAGWDMGAGLAWTDGTIKTGATDPASETYVSSTGIDFQAIGDLGTIPSEFYVSYAQAPKSTASKTNEFNGSLTDDTSAFALMGKFYVAPRTSVYLAYGDTNQGDSNTRTETTIGAQYMLAQNIKLELFNVGYSSDSTNIDGRHDYSMLMLFSGF